MSLLESVPFFSPDPILGLLSLFSADTREHKVNLLIGEYFDEEKKFNGQQSVKLAEKLLLEQELDKKYLNIDGFKQYLEEYKKCIFDDDVKTDLIYGCQALGGTGALSLAALLFSACKTSRKVFISQENWANHSRIFSQQGFDVSFFPYFNQQAKGFDLENCLKVLNNAEKHSLVLLQGCCHNPTGVDPSKEEWLKILNLIKERELYCCFDLAYQGFGDSFEKDAWAVNLFVKELPFLLIATCNSKNFSLYGERIGALFVSVSEKNDFDKVAAFIKEKVRGLYSSPPRRGALIVQKILSDLNLKAMWKTEIDVIRNKIQSKRILLIEALRKEIGNDFDFLLKQKGFFSYLDFSSKQVLFLREELAVYVTKGGRLNLAGINDKNLNYIVKAIKIAHAL